MAQGVCLPGIWIALASDLLHVHGLLMNVIDSGDNVLLAIVQLSTFSETNNRPALPCPVPAS
jgi:hypothetical protein